MTPGFLPALVAAFLTALHLCGVAAALHAVMHARTSQGATAWAVALVSFPYAALPLYLVLGQRKFHGYIDARRAKNERVSQYILSFRERFDYRIGIPGWEPSYEEVLEKLAPMPFSGFNAVRLLVNGEETFAAIFKGIDHARHYALVQFFIIKDDVLGRELKARLLAAAARGVKVYLIFDEIGCHALPSSYVSELRRAGVEATSFRTTQGARNRFQINFRNHRKIVVADGRTAWVGGLNVGDEYMGRHRRFGPWRDTHVELQGPAVQAVQLSFVEDWHWATGVIPPLQWEPLPADGGGTHVLVLPTGPADRLESCSLFFAESINRAKSRVWITSPYFVPDSQIMTCLQLAALRGVDVRIMLPGMPDHLLVYLSSFSFIKEVDPVGVKFYRYEEGFLHQKVILVDDYLAGVGTANMDNRSFRLNFEITVVVVDRGFAGAAAAMLERDFERSRLVGTDEYDKRPFLFKAAVQTARLMAPIQ